MNALTIHWWCDTCPERGTYPDPMPKSDASLPDAKHVKATGHSTRTSVVGWPT